MKDILFVSNGHGEDMIAGKVIDAVISRRPDLELAAWPMVGEGGAYAARGLPLTGTLNLLPSAGFATLNAKLMREDLKAGWIRTHWNQLRDARALPGKYRMLVAVGDIVPILAGVFSRAPFMFVGCAKSSYYSLFHGYTRMEKRLLRRHCAMTFPRDRLTTKELDRARVPNTYVGNPMMDGLDGTGDRLGIGEGAFVVGMMAGTRSDAETNLLDLLAGAGTAVARFPDPKRLRFVFPVRDQFDAHDVARSLASDGRIGGWQVETVNDAREGVVMTLAHPGGARVVIAKKRFADVLHMADLVVGMAGTANEQAIGFGIPLITVPSSGVQGEQYVRMKMEFFGDAAIAVPRDAERIGASIVDLAADTERCARMAAAGRERMGDAGASAAIAGHIIEALDAGANGRRK